MLLLPPVGCRRYSLPESRNVRDEMAGQGLQSPPLCEHLEDLSENPDLRAAAVLQVVGAADLVEIAIAHQIEVTSHEPRRLGPWAGTLNTDKPEELVGRPNNLLAGVLALLDTFHRQRLNGASTAGSHRDVEQNEPDYRSNNSVPKERLERYGALNVLKGTGDKHWTLGLGVNSVLLHVLNQTGLSPAAQKPGHDDKPHQWLAKRFHERGDRKNVDD